MKPKRVSSKATEEGEIDPGVSKRTSSFAGWCLAEGDRHKVGRARPNSESAELFLELRSVDLTLGEEDDAPAGDRPDAGPRSRGRWMRAVRVVIGQRLQFAHERLLDRGVGPDQQDGAAREAILAVCGPRVHRDSVCGEIFKGSLLGIGCSKRRLETV